MMKGECTFLDEDGLTYPQCYGCRSYKTLKEETCTVMWDWVSIDVYAGTIHRRVDVFRRRQCGQSLAIASIHLFAPRKAGSKGHESSDKKEVKRNIKKGLTADWARYHLRISGAALAPRWLYSRRLQGCRAECL